MASEDARMEGKHKEYIASVFNKVLSRYPALQESTVLLKHAPLKGATMNARPVLSPASVFKGITSYQIIVAEFVRDSSELRVGELPEEVLSGWFAHELGHVMDYLNRSFAGMIVFGGQYLFSGKFRRKAEFVADQYAIRHGFHEEIIAAKRFILEHELLDPAYKEKISKYYMPIEQVRWHSDNPHTLENLFMN